MKCPKCGYSLTDNDVICPICESIISENIKTDNTNNNTNNVNKIRINYKRLKTNKFVRLLLSYMFSVGISLFLILFLIDYHPIEVTPIPTFRQVVALLVVFIHWSYIFQAPFVTEHNSADKNKHLSKDERIKAFVYYFIRFFIFMSIWQLFLGKFVELNLTLSYNDMYRFTIIKDTIPHATYLLYTRLYYLGLILSYLPYMIYYIFDLYFESSDVKKQVVIFICINLVVFLAVTNM